MMATELKHRGFVWHGWPHLFILLFAFLAGVVSGFLLVFLGGRNQDVQSYLLDRFSYATNGGLHVSFFSAVWECVRWPLFVLIFSFHTLGILAIPALICIRGFLLSYAISVLSFTFPLDGLIISIVLFATTVLLIVPILFLWGSEGLCSLALRRFSASSGQGRFRIEVILIGIGALLVAIAVQWALIPFVFNFVCAQLY